MTQVYHAPTIEAAAKVATSFLVGDPKNGVPLRSPIPHEIAAAIRALPTPPGPTTGEASEPSPLSEQELLAPLSDGVIDRIIAELSADEINALPKKLRRYVYAIETRCDPTGDTQTIWSQREQIEGLLKRVRELEAAADGGSDALGETVARLRELMAKATPGEWTISQHSKAEGPNPIDTVKVLPIQHRALGSVERADGELIVAMKRALPTLLSALEQRQESPCCDQQRGAAWIDGKYKPEWCPKHAPLPTHPEES